jgi:hypothetical protein
VVISAIVAGVGQLLGIVGRGSKRNGLMVLKEETADVVLFRESVDGADAKGSKRERAGATRLKCGSSGGYELEGTSQQDRLVIL